MITINKASIIRKARIACIMINVLLVIAVLTCAITGWKISGIAILLGSTVFALLHVAVDQINKTERKWRKENE